MRDAANGFSTVGARVTLESSAGLHAGRIVTGDSYSAQHAATVHFGLGQLTEVEAINVQWANGAQRRIERPAINQYITVTPVPSPGVGGLSEESHDCL